MLYLTQSNIEHELTVSTTEGIRRAVRCFKNFFYLKESYDSAEDAKVACRNYLDQGYTSLVIEEHLKFQVWNAIEEIFYSNNNSEEKDLKAPQIEDLIWRYKQNSFTGQLRLSSKGNLHWTLYFFKGHVVWAMGGQHPLRCLQRNLVAACPSLERERQWNLTLDRLSTGEGSYQLLCSWVAQGILPNQVAVKAIRDLVAEILFDIFQNGIEEEQIEKSNLCTEPLILIEPTQILIQQKKLWQQWQRSKLTKYSPNQAPIIKNGALLQEKTTPQLYAKLLQLLDGTQTIRDVALNLKKTNRDVLASLLPYLKAGAIALKEIEDLKIPETSITNTTVSYSANNSSYLVACVDDNAWMCQTLEILLQKAGYKFIGIKDPLEAVPKLLGSKPDLIFLDLKMPKTNGYELCQQLRSLSQFKNTPILILTSSDGVIDQVRAKMVGATNFINKSVDDNMILETVKRYLFVPSRDKISL